MNLDSSIISRLKEWLKNKDINYLVLLLATAIFVRLYYFITSSGQPLWWDEAEYMSAAKHWAFGVPYNLNEQRPPLFQLLAAGLLKLGFGEVVLKLILVVIPSIALVVATYYLGKEMFNPKIATWGSLGVAFTWSLLFWTARFQPDFFSVTFQLVAILFFWRFIKHQDSKSAIYAGLFTATGFYFKISTLLVPISMAVFAFYYEGFSLFKKKNYWLIFGAFLVGMIPFMIWQAISFGNPLAFAPTYSGDFNLGRSLGWMTLDFYHQFAKPVMFLLFLIGVSTFLIGTFGKLNKLLKNKNLRKDPWLFSFIVLLTVTLFYIFYIKGTIEDRWVFLMIPFIFFFAAKTLTYIYEDIGKHSKILAWIIIFGCMLAFIVPQINHTADLVNVKKNSYSPVKDASLLIKENSQPGDKILSVSYTQTTAYAEREVITYSRMPIENFTKILEEEHPKFVIVSLFEMHHPEWIIRQVENDQGFKGILFPYFNSSIIFSPEGQVVQYDIKDKVVIEEVVFTLIYPYDNNFGGLLAYKIDYK